MNVLKRNNKRMMNVPNTGCDEEDMIPRNQRIPDNSLRISIAEKHHHSTVLQSILTSNDDGYLVDSNQGFPDDQLNDNEPTLDKLIDLLLSRIPKIEPNCSAHVDVEEEVGTDQGETNTST